MPRYDTPQPITASLSLLVAQVRITASDRRDTVVEVSPSDASNADDIKVAEQTTVELSGSKLVVKTPKQWRHYGLFGGPGSIDVAIELPTGSQLNSQMAMGDLRAKGRLDDCRVASAAGNIWLDQTGRAHLSTGAGEVTVDQAAGSLEVAGAGEIRAGEIAGNAVIKNLNGDTWLGDVAGDLRCTAANGNVTIGRARRSVAAKSANGNIRIGEVGQGAIVIETAAGELEIGIPEGTAARLDARSRFGTVRNDLTTAAGPSASDQTVEVKARTAFGDIIIRRSAAITNG